MKRLFLFLFWGMLCAASCTEKNDNTIASGTAGTLTWTFSKDGTLTISGKGEVPDFQLNKYYELEPYCSPPWYEYRDDITKVIIGDEVSSIGNEAFGDCSKMISATIGNSTVTIGHGAFRACKNLNAIDIPNSVTIISSGAFQSCENLKTVDIPNSVTTIGGGAFAFCYSLTSVSIGNSATIVGDAFRMCTSLTKIINYREIPQIIHITITMGTSDNPFAGVDLDKCTLLVPAVSVEVYRATTVWNWFGNINKIQ